MGCEAPSLLLHQHWDGQSFGYAHGIVNGVIYFGIWKNIPEFGNFNAPKLARQVVFEINLTDCVT
jgi:hypothetical protein